MWRGQLEIIDESQSGLDMELEKLLSLLALSFGGSMRYEDALSLLRQLGSTLNQYSGQRSTNGESLH